MSTGLRHAPPVLKAMVPLIFIVVMMAFTTAGSGNEFTMDLSDPALISMMKVSQFIGALILFVIPAFVLAYMLFEDRVDGLTLKIAPKATIIFLSALLIIAAQPMIGWLSEVNLAIKLPESMSAAEQWMKNSEKTMGELTKAFLSDRTIIGLITNLFIIAFLAAFGEELLFRGVLQKTLIASTRNIHLGVWLAAIVFSAVHMQFYGFLPRMFLGAVLGYVFVWSGSIWIPIIVHFINNGAAVLLSFFTGNPDVEKIGGSTDAATDPIMVGASAVVTVGLLYLIATRSKPRISATTA